MNRRCLLPFWRFTWLLWLAALSLHAADFNVSTPGNVFNYTIDGVAGNPTLTLVRGRTYTFAINTCSCHPFEIMGAPGGSVTNNNISQGTITFVVPTTATNYSYRCSIHLFSGTLNTIDPPQAPTVSTGSVKSNIPGFSSVILSGTVNPNGSATTASFLYGTDPGLTAPSTLIVGQTIGSGTSPVTVNATLTGLLENKTYFYRLQATNEGGSQQGVIKNFKTLNTDASLATLSVDGAILSPAFDPDILVYSATITTATAVVHSAATDSGATIYFNSPYLLITPSHLGDEVVLDGGLTVLTFKVVASDHSTSRDYTLNLTHDGPEIAFEALSRAVYRDVRTINFPATLPGSKSSQWMRLSNPGTQTLTLSTTLNSLSSPFQLLTALPASLEPGESIDCELQYSPKAAGSTSSDFTIFSNDANEYQLKIYLEGNSHTVKFESSDLTVFEDNHSIKIPVRISSPLSVPWSVAVSYTGTALQGSDYTATASPLHFAAHQSVAYLTITLKDDLVLEGAEDLVVTLQSASDSRVKVGDWQPMQETYPNYSTFRYFLRQAELKLTIKDGVPVTIAPMLPNSVVILGTPISLSTTVTGSDPLTLSWKKNSTVLQGETSNTLSVATTATLNDAGSYTLTAKNQRGTVSSTAQVAVVDTRAQTVRANAGTSPKLVANAAGNTLSYLWRKNGVDIATTDSHYSGARTKTLTLKAVQISETGDVYTCLVTAPAGSQITGNFTLQVPVEKPIALTPVIPDVVIYNDFSYPLPFDTTPAKAPTKFLCSGLPPGLSCNSATGLISGKPTKAGSYTVTVTLSNAAGPADATVQDTFEVKAFPAEAVGAYTGLFGRHVATNDSLGGRVDFNVSSNGAFTGTLKLGGLSWTLKASLQTLATAGAHPGTTLLLARSGRLPLTLTLDIDPATHLLTGSVIEHSSTTGSLLEGWRNVWHTTAPPNPVTSTLGAHSAVIEPAATGPQGYGYAFLNVSPAGATTVAGRTADGGVISASGLLSPAGEVPVFSLLYGNKGSILGNLAITADPGHTIKSPLDWQKTLVTTTRDYMPYGPLTVTAKGSLHSVTIPMLSLAAGHYRFSDGGVASSATVPDVPIAISTLNKLSIGTPNPASLVSLSFDPTKGNFSGKFTLKDPPASPRTVTFQGLMVPSQGKGFGYFLLPQLADPLAMPPTTSSTSPILSGKVELGL